MNTNHTFAIPAYKESPHLQDCIDSLKKQAVLSEIILCTSTPSAFLEDIARKNNLQLFINPDAKGIANDWNFALEKSATNYVTLTHQDDIYFPDYTSEILKTAESKKGSLIIFSNYNEIVHNNHKVFVRKNSLNFFVKKIILRLFFGNKNYIVKNKKRFLAFGSPIGCPTVTFHKKNIGDFKFDANFSIDMDWKAWCDLAQKEGSFVWAQKTLVSHRIYPESETSNGLTENRRQREDLEMFKLLWPNYIASLFGKIYTLSYKNNKN